MTNGISFSPGTRDICALHHVHQGAIGYCAKPIPEETCIIGSWVLRIVFKYSKFGGRGPYTRPLSVSFLIHTSFSHTITARWPPSWSSNRKGSIWESYTALGIEPRTFSYPGRFIYHSIVVFVGLKKLTVTRATYIQIPISAHGWRQYIGLYGVRPLTKLQSLSFGTNLDPAHINIMQKAACSLAHLEGVSKTSICICWTFSRVCLFSCVKAHFRNTAIFK